MAKENLNRLRQYIAQSAARMMAEEGVSDYAYAKKKAGRQVGVSKNDVLPSNFEVEEELKLYQSLFLSETQPENLVALRKNALHTMQMLEQFNPHLTGAVLDGTAGLGSETHIHLFAESLKEVEIFLLNQGIPFEAGERTHAMMHDAKRNKKDDKRKVPVFTLEMSTGLIKLSVFNVDDIRRPTKRAADGSYANRANIQAVMDAGFLN